MTLLWALNLATSRRSAPTVGIVDSKTGSGIDDYTLRIRKSARSTMPTTALSFDVEEDAAPPSHHVDRSARLQRRLRVSLSACRNRTPSSNFQLKKEDTEFRLSTDATDWLLALPNYRSSYESEYVELPTSALSNQGGVSSHFLIGLPLLIHEPGVAWMDIVEADLEGSTSMYVTNPSGQLGRPLVFRIAIAASRSSGDRRRRRAALALRVARGRGRR